MTDNNAFERFVAEHLADDGSDLAQAERLAARIDERISERRQWPRWLALIKESPMRTNDHLAVGSPTVRATAVIFATLLLAVALAAVGTAGQRLLAAADVLIVAQDGSGQYTTITDAVAAADDGDEILVRPGEYAEAVTIDKDIDLRGDGPTDRIIITAPEDGPTHEVRFLAWGPAPYALLLQGADASISGLTLRGERARLFADGGTPVIEDLAFDGVSAPFQGTFVAGAIVINGGAMAIVRDNELRGGGALHVFEGSDVRIEQNERRDGPNISGEYGDASVIRDNTISGTGRQGITFLGPTRALVEANTISDRNVGITPGVGISVGQDLMPVIRGNIIRENRVGITVRNGTSPVVTANTLSGNETGISVGASDSTISDNRLRGNRTAISVVGAGRSPSIEGNAVTGGSIGIVIAAGASPTLTGNTIEGADDRGLVVYRAFPTLIDNIVCGNDTNLEVDASSELVMQDNEICQDASVEATE